ncbi:putative leader peptide [Peterkaempfera griseoplana]|uniref:putative leader peptide n=1 Tax=Peterkaempfera griseoplana TaxID=66896 RepID=UPI0012FE8E26|nr:putative leader peptide [Peterkaempfera griseoplana]
MREAPERSAVVTVKAQCRVTTMCSRRHIDLQRVAAALCPAYGHAGLRHASAPHTAS